MTPRDCESYTRPLIISRRRAVDTTGARLIEADRLYRAARGALVAAADFGPGSAEQFAARIKARHALAVALVALRSVDLAGPLATVGREAARDLRRSAYFTGYPAVRGYLLCLDPRPDGWRTVAT